MVYRFGDRRQRINAWRGAARNFDEDPVDRTFNLNVSHRFGDNIAGVANRIASVAGEGSKQSLRGIRALEPDTGSGHYL